MFSTHPLISSSHFGHTAYGLIQINNFSCSLEDFLTQEPDYKLPDGVQSRNYLKGESHTLVANDGSIFTADISWPEGDRYISQVERYRAALATKDSTAPPTAPTAPTQGVPSPTISELDAKIKALGLINTASVTPISNIDNLQGEYWQWDSAELIALVEFARFKSALERQVYYQSSPVLRRLSDEHLWVAVRWMRSLLLNNSDWTQLPDAKLDSTAREAWAAYRQRLRDITQFFSRPQDVTWPDEPGSVQTADAQT